MDSPPTYLTLFCGFLLLLVPHWGVLLQADLLCLGILHHLLVVLPEILFLGMGVLAEGLVDLAQWPYGLLRRPVTGSSTPNGCCVAVAACTVIVLLIGNCGDM